MNINTRDMPFVKFNEQDMPFVKFNGVTVYESWKNLTASGVPPLTLNKCKGVDLLDYKLYGNSVQETANNHNLPSEYREVEYIESTGTQYIDTGVIPDQDTGFDIVYLTKNPLGTTNYGAIMGARYQSQQRELQLTTYTNSPSTVLGTLRYSQTGHNAGITVNKKMRSTLMNKVYTNNEGYELTLNSTFTSPVSLTVFALNNNGAVQQHGKVQLYSLKMYEGETLVRDFVPCYRKSDKELGLYDLVENKFYINEGTGEFVKGVGTPAPEQPIEVESVGDKTTKNLFNGVLKNGQFSYGETPNYKRVEITLEAGTYSISFSEKIYKQSSNITFTNPSGNFQTNTFTLTETTDCYIQFRGYDNVNGAGQTEEFFNSLKIQVEEGDTVTEYEPPNKYKIPVKVRTKNIANIEGMDSYKFTSGTMSDVEPSTGSFKVVAQWGMYGVKLSTLFPKIEADKEYYLFAKVDASNVKYCYLYGKSRTWTFGTKQKITQADLDAANGFGIYGANDGSVTQYTGFMIIPAEVYEANYNSDFEPYQEPTEVTTNIFLDEPLRKLGDYSDYIQKEIKVINGEKIITQKVVRQITDIKLNGGFGVYNDVIWQLRTPNSLIKTGKEKVTHFIIGDSTVLAMHNKNATGYYICVSRVEESMGMTIDEFNTWVDENNIHYYAVLETPTEETIELPDIPTLKGMTVLSVDTEILPSNMEVTYKGKN